MKNNPTAVTFPGTLAAVLVVGLLAACGTSPHYGGPMSAPASVPATADQCATDKPETICWTPVQARFHPDGQRMVVNLCSNRRNANYYCRMVEYRIAEQRWHLIPGQEEGKSYFYPSYSNDGKTLVFGAAHCEQPYCAGNRGYGQLATMNVDAKPGKAAGYGPLKLWPVMGMSRPSFTADDQRVLYWRSHYSARLTSGRSISSISVFEYRFATDEETHPIESLYTGQKTVRFIDAWTSPRYSLDGKVLRFSGMVDNLIRSPDRVWIGGGDPDVEYRGPQAELVHRRVDRVMEGLGRVYVEHPERGILAGPGNLRLVDAKTLQTKAVFVNPEPYQVADADIERTGQLAVGISGVRAVTNGNQGPKRTYWLTRDDPKDLRKQIPAAPVLALVNLGTGAVQALHWPNLETLTAP